MELTQKIVETVLYEGRSYMSKGGRKRWTRHVLWDDGLPGFGLRITSTNRKSFIVSYRTDGRKRTKTLGTADELQLDEARRRATEFLASRDEPQPSAAAGRPRIDGVDTVAQLTEAYLEHHLKSATPSWFTDQRLMRRHIKPAIGRSPIAEVTPNDLATLGNRVARRFPADARRLKPLLTGMFDWAAEQGLWSKAPRAAGRAKARPAAAPQTGPATPGDGEPSPEPQRSVEELAEALRRSEEQRRELAARLEEVSSSGVEMLARINEQAAAHQQVEAKLAQSRRESEKVRADAENRPDPEKTARQIHNLRQSVEQLMTSVEEVTGEREELTERLAKAETTVGEQARKVTALARARNKLEERLREEERKAAIRKVQHSAGRDRKQLFIGLAAGAVAGILLTFLLQAVTGAEKSPTMTARGGPAASVSGDPDTPVGIPDTTEVAAPAANEVGAAPPAAAGEPPIVPETVGDEPDFATAEAAVRSWAAAWSEQRVDDYLEAYSATFTPTTGQDRRDWAAQRRDRILRPPSIRVSLAALDVLASGPDRVRVTFEQSYETPTYADQVLKTLELAWEDGGWKIVAEQAG